MNGTPDLRGLRTLLITTGVVFAVFAVLGALTLIELRQAQAEFRAEQVARAEAVCESSVQGRATQVVFGEVLIIAATSNDDDGAGDAAEIGSFRTLIDEVVVGAPAPSCRGVITDEQFRRRVQRRAADMLDRASRRR